MRVFILIFIPFFSAQAFNYDGIIVKDIVRVYDGDTFTINIPQYPDLLGHKIGIRINGIDTPELRGKCDEEKRLAQKAKQATLELLHRGKLIQLKNLQRGKYFRIVADVMIDGKNIADRLIDAGLAYEYHGGRKQRWCVNE